MKTLQNNFTTPELSKRLLELGVPADSSDCYYTQEEIEGNIYWFDLHIKREYQPHTNLHASTIWGEILPCWSVGRLIEIFRICGDVECLVWLNARYSKWDIEDLVEAFELYAQEDDILSETVLNFSKLED